MSPCALGILFLLQVAMAVPGDYEERARSILTQMTPEEKVTMLHGLPIWKPTLYVGKVEGVPRLGIPPLLMNDGPQGFRDQTTILSGGKGKSTAFPSAITLAATFDPDLCYLWGAAMSAEFLAKGSNVQLAPGLNVARVPTNGRNFEYLSGEDPFLGATLVKPVIEGIQSNGVIANAKHFALNNQETNRGSVSAVVDERTRWEVYYPPFQAAVEAGVASFMCSYNRVNGVHACENEGLMKELKEDMGFEGWVMSDWFATHSTVPSALAGLDQEMPQSLYFGLPLLAAVKKGQVPMEVINDKALRILKMMFKHGLLDRKPLPGWPILQNVTSEEHNTLARKLAASGAVLLKNEGSILPLPVDGSLKSISVVGSCAHDKPIIGGGGSGAVTPPYVVTVLDGIRASVSSDVKVQYMPTWPSYTKRSGLHPKLSSADVIVAVVGLTSQEGRDRSSLALSASEDAMITAAASSGKPVIVVCMSPGAILMPWSDSVQAIVAMFLPGQEVGNALADVLFGRVNPSGRLPLTFPNGDNEVKFSPQQYPGVQSSSGPFTEAVYSEKLLVGYRYYDYYGIEPKFPFGHGLSYTTFAYSDLEVKQFSSIHLNGITLSEGSLQDGERGWSPLTVVVKVTNTGDLDGSEVVQLYVSRPSTFREDGYLEPPKQLRGFQKVYVRRGEGAEVEFHMTERDFSVWSTDQHKFVLVHGTFQIGVGASSRDIRLTSSVDV